MKQIGYPPKQGLYDPAYEHDSCGVGFVVHIGGEKSNDVVIQGLTILNNLSHRGAQGADPETGDGAGILIQIPHEFFKAELALSGGELPAFGSYAVGMVFFPPKAESAQVCRSVFERAAGKEGFKVLAWRDVPVDNSRIGLTAKEVQPVVRQVFIFKPGSVREQSDLERKLYILRRLIEKEVAASSLADKRSFYVLSLSSRTIVYKGLLMTGQLKSFYKDLSDERLVSALALVHSRYSTNTFPTWDLSQPFRLLAHNGEINTLRGNINWMSARQASLASYLFGEDIKKLFPVIVPGGSDSAALDNMAEFLIMSGRPIEHVMMMLIPEAWENDASLDESKKGFY
ncbi:MAG: glutamate synthase subunit alpha, partial [Candidatus Omnitrophica bacterium CG_4_10_14_0_2_um_filter_44_9]